MTETAQALANEWGGTWSGHPLHELEDWQREVSENNTRLSYWDWVLAQIEASRA